MAIEFQQEVVYWTGNGGASQAVPVSFACDSGVVVVQAFAAGASPAVMRFSGMTFALTMGSTNQTTNPISALTATGFTVTNDSPLGAGAGLNVAARKYAAIVWRDTSGTSTDSKHLRTGSYLGAGDHAAQITVINGSTDITVNTLAPTDVGRQLNTGQRIASWLSSTSAVLDAVWTGSTGLNNVTVLGATQRVFTPPINIGELYRPSHAWVWGRGVAYKALADHGAGDSSQVLAVEAPNPVTDIIIGIAAGYFDIGNNVDVNNNAKTHYWFTLDDRWGISGANIFKSYKIACTAAGTDQVTGLGFQVELATAERYLTGGVPGAQGAWWRSANAGVHSGTNSNIQSSGASGANSITAVGNGTIDIGTTIGTNGDDVYGYACALSGTISPTGTSIVGSGGASVGGGSGSGGGVGGTGGVSAGGAMALTGLGSGSRGGGGSAPELYGDQWGLHRYDFKSRREEIE